MGNKIKNAFEPIKASDQMKASTVEYLRHMRTAQSPKPAVHTWRRALVLACTMLFMVMGIGGLGLYTVRTPVSYVSIDINPSIELALNRYNRVISATAYNEDGMTILAHLKVSGMTYTQAIDTIVESDAMQPYLTADAALTFTVASESADRETEIVTGIKNCHSCSSHKGVSYTADISFLSEAHECGMSLGKYAAYLTLSQYDDTITAEDCLDMTMAEIHQQIHSHESGGGHESSEKHQNSGNCKAHGNGNGNRHP